MKVLLLQKMAGISGSERYFLSILPELRRRGVDASFLVVQHPANAQKNLPFIAELRAAGVPVHVFDARLSLTPLLIWRIARLIQREGIDVLHSNLIHADVWGACVKLFFLPRLPLVSMKHGYSDSFQSQHGLDPSRLTRNLLTIASTWASRHADRVVAISTALKSFLVKGRLVDDRKALAIPYGFDFSKAPSLVEAGSLRYGAPQIVMAGRLVGVKQNQLMLEILPDLVRDFPEICVVMVGAGPMLESWKEKAAALGVSDHVRWEGFRSNMHDYIRDSDLMVITSAAEGFGLVVLEAWHHGKPVVAFDVPAINEIIESGSDGVLVPPFDTAELRRTLQRLMSEPGALGALGSAGKRKQVAVYGLATMCERTIRVYEEVLSRPLPQQNSIGEMP